MCKQEGSPNPKHLWFLVVFWCFCLGNWWNSIGSFIWSTVTFILVHITLLLSEETMTVAILGFSSRTKWDKHQHLGIKVLLSHSDWVATASCPPKISIYIMSFKVGIWSIEFAASLNGLAKSSLLGLCNSNRFGSYWYLIEIQRILQGIPYRMVGEPLRWTRQNLWKPTEYSICCCNAIG